MDRDETLASNLAVRSDTSTYAPVICSSCGYVTCSYDSSVICRVDDNVIYPSDDKTPPCCRLWGGEVVLLPVVSNSNVQVLAYDV